MTVDALSIPGPVGAPRVGLVVHTPIHAVAPLPCVLHLHGGGFIAGSAAENETVLRSFAAAANCVVASVNYRLAPETPFPGALEDCYAALAWLNAAAPSLAVDPRRIGVMGESAGGGLAAGLALLARDRGEHALAFQHLLYPMLDDRTCTQADPNPLAGEFIWNRSDNAFGWTSLLGGPPGSPEVSPYAAPARAADLTMLPPAYLAVGALDLFLDESLAYGQRLMRSGVAVELHVYPGAYHSFDYAMHATVAVQARRDSLNALKRELRPVD